ncbi:exodeoxyribonuclease VII large subunit [Spirochaeta dissipatitropha]
MIDDAAQAYKVSEITEIISNMLESSLRQISVEGELSNFRPAASGHWYFSLKDEDAVISAAMFRGRNSRIDFKPADGMMVRVQGSISVYAKRGSYQIICDSMQQAGIGDILRVLEERKRRLAAEGLFDSDRKRPLPKLPGKIAILTSPTGAAVRDILQVLKRRNSGLHAVIVPCIVQGDSAAASILSGMESILRHDLGDVIIVGRGGGSLEDLLPFSDEKVVRAIAASPVPVISAVGHEIDWALSDFAADLRAPTPSAAAELVTGNREELYRRVMDCGHGVSAAFMQRIHSARALISRFEPESLQERYAAFQQPFLQRLDDAKEDLLQSLDDICKGYRQRIDLAQVSLEALSPFTVLSRGYAIVRKGDGSVCSRVSELGETDRNISVELHDGYIDADVTKKRSKI